VRGPSALADGPLAGGVSASGERPSLGGAAASSDRCAACGSMLAPDQRYCLECGERRGQARFSPGPPSATTVTTTTTRGPRRPPRLSSGTTLIAGVGTLLLAMLIGVLIGRTGSNTTPGSSKVQVVQIGGGSGTASTASTPSSNASSGSGAGSKKHGKSKSSRANGGKTVSSKKLTAANATQTVKNLPPPTVTVGAKGSGPGYSKGHFTGNFFGP
jgi:hypothetical protein